MKKQSQIPDAAGALLLWAVHQFSARHKPVASGRQVFVSHRPTSAAELRLFAQAWSMPTKGAVEVLVYLRTWLHNLILGGATSSYYLDDGEIEVLAGYARWLDGLPQVVRRLPDAVLLEEPVCVPLRLPEHLPPGIAERGRAAVLQDAQEEGVEAAGSPFCSISVKRGQSNAERRARQDRLGGSFAQSSSSAVLGTQGPLKNRAVALGRR